MIESTLWLNSAETNHAHSTGETKNTVALRQHSSARRLWEIHPRTKRPFRSRRFSPSARHHQSRRDHHRPDWGSADLGKTAIRSRGRLKRHGDALPRQSVLVYQRAGHFVVTEAQLASLNCWWSPVWARPVGGYGRNLAEAAREAQQQGSFFELQLSRLAGGSYVAANRWTLP